MHLYTRLKENFIFSKPTKYASKPTTQGNLNRRCFQLRITIPADDNLEGIEHCIIGETHINPLPMPQFKLDFFFKKWAIPGLFFFIFVFSIQLTVNVQYIFCWWLDLNSRPLVMEATALPTEPPPLPQVTFLYWDKTILFTEKLTQHMQIPLKWVTRYWRSVWIYSGLCLSMCLHIWKSPSSRKTFSSMHKGPKGIKYELK